MPEALELRIVITAEDFDRLVTFYREALQLDIEKQWARPTGRGVVFSLPRAALEIVDPPQAEEIDRVEAGRRLSGPVRLALQVSDIHVAAEAARQAGAVPERAVVRTPWDHLCARFRAPDGLQLTLFEVPTSGPESA